MDEWAEHVRLCIASTPSRWLNVRSRPDHSFCLSLSFSYQLLTGYTEAAVWAWGRAVTAKREGRIG